MFPGRTIAEHDTTNSTPLEASYTVNAAPTDRTVQYHSQQFATDK